MFGKLGDMMGKLQEMKQQADAVKAKLNQVTLKAEAAGGDIQVEINGNREIKHVRIAPSLQHGDAEELQDQLVVALNRAIKLADEAHDKEMKSVAAGLLPGMM
jgi:DNA-binding YbaB/EbfC family protein